MAASNLAAWSPAPKADLEVKDAQLYTVTGDELLIKVSPLPITWESVTDQFGCRTKQLPSSPSMHLFAVMPISIYPTPLSSEMAWQAPLLRWAPMLLHSK
jgi:hypothetical protein